jgi:hypothetical protein
MPRSPVCLPSKLEAEGIGATSSPAASRRPASRLSLTWTYVPRLLQTTYREWGEAEAIRAPGSSGILQQLPRAIFGLVWRPAPAEASWPCAGGRNSGGRTAGSPRHSVARRPVGDVACVATPTRIDAVERFVEPGEHIECDREQLLWHSGDVIEYRGAVQVN